MQRPRCRFLLHESHQGSINNCTGEVECHVLFKFLKSQLWKQGHIPPSQTQVMFMPSVLQNPCTGSDCHPCSVVGRWESRQLLRVVSPWGQSEDKWFPTTVTIDYLLGWKCLQWKRKPWKLIFTRSSWPLFPSQFLLDGVSFLFDGISLSQPGSRILMRLWCLSAVPIYLLLALKPKHSNYRLLCGPCGSTT